MARDHARILLSVWGDSAWCGLTERQQRLYWTLLTQRGLSYAGVVDFTPSRLARLAKDSTVASVRRTIAELETARYVETDADTDEILLRTFVRHDGLLDSPNMTKAMVRDRFLIVSDRLRDRLDTEIRKAYRIGADRKGWKGLAETDPDLWAKVSGAGA